MLNCVICITPRSIRRSVSHRRRSRRFDESGPAVRFGKAAVTHRRGGGRVRVLLFAVSQCGDGFRQGGDVRVSADTAADRRGYGLLHRFAPMVSLGKPAGVSCLENDRPAAVRLDHNDLVPLLDTESAVDRDVQIASDPVTAYHRRAASFARIKHLVTCRSQYRMHLLSFVPPPGLAHLPTQFAA
jgi:hypothetical protein